MGWGGWLVVIGGGAAGYWLYRRLKRIESEILEEIRSPRQRESPAPAGPGKGEPPVGTAVPKEEKAPEPVAAPEARVLDIVRSRPGILQTELYEHFAEESRREIQDLLLQMDRDGRVSREREGSTYRLTLPDEASETAS